MSPTASGTRPGYWIVSSILLIWALAYTALVIEVFFVATPATFDALVTAGTILPGYSDYVQHLPAWVVVLSLVKAATRLAGALALMLRSRLAVLFFSLSFVLVLIIFMRGFLFAHVGSVIRPSQMFVEALFFALSIYAVWFSARALLRGQLR